MLIALDANVIVHALTGQSFLRGATRNWIQAAEEHGALLTTSALSRLECFVRPYRLNRTSEQRLFASFFDRIVVVPIEDDMLALAARIRAGNRSIRTPDAVHLASAQMAQADLFLTADRRLKAYRRIRVAYVLRDAPESFIA